MSSPPPPGSRLTFQRHLEAHKPHASPFLGTKKCCWPCPLLSLGWRLQADSVVSSLRNSPGLNWAWPSVLCLLASAQQGGRWAGRSISPVTAQSNISVKGMDLSLFLPPMEEVWHFTKLARSSRGGPSGSANYHEEDFTGGKVINAYRGPRFVQTRNAANLSGSRINKNGLVSVYQSRGWEGRGYKEPYILGTAFCRTLSSKKGSLFRGL